MEYFHGTTDFYTEKAAAVTLGKFDGIHRGHQKLMSRIKEQEAKRQLYSVCFAFNSNKGSRIYTGEEQKLMMEQLGISCFIDCPFVPQISGMSPERFVKEILVNRLHANYIAVGTDFRFGYQRAGDVGLLMDLQKTCGFRVEIVEKECCGQREISSTYVREALWEGDMELANNLLGRPFFIHGRVLHGRHIGRTLGMPTVNLVPAEEKLLPPNGVYASRTLIDGRSYPGITNIGYKPTVGERFRGVETYIFDLDMDLYGKELAVELYCFERPEQKFPSLDELKTQMQKDIAFGREYFCG